uniref:Zinc finger BED domain-containing protein 4 n=1 Tax=Phallusia mammillata TaxID=59560 RepID=A0A6F9DXW4_9ASCI|nr:zinc finger BED domain-containing protein 4 [Phallusia mammillata]
MPRGKTSIVWDHFSQPDGENQVVCQVCQTKLTYCSSTGSLIKHLKYKHSHLWPGMVAAHGVPREATLFSVSAMPPYKRMKLEQDPPHDNSITVTSDFQFPVAQDCLPSTTATSSALVTADSSTFVFKLDNSLFEKLSRPIIADQRPVSFISDPGLRDLVLSLNPVNEFPGEQEMREFLKLKYFGAKSKLLYKTSDAVEKDTRFAVACRFRQSVYGEWFVTIGIHYISGSWERMYFTLETHCVTPDSADIIALITAALSHYNIPKSSVIAYVDDCKQLSLETLDGLCPKPLTCIAHKLEQLVSGALMNNQEVAASLKSAKKMLSFIKTKDDFTRILKVMQQSDKQAPTSCDRWPGVYALLECLISHKDELTSIIDNYSTSLEALSFSSTVDYDLPDHCWSILGELLELLRPFWAMTEFLSKERHPPIAACPLLVSGLERLTRPQNQPSLSSNENTESTLNFKCVENVRASLHERLLELSSFDGCDWINIAAALDPRFYKLKHLKRDEKNAVHETVSDLCAPYSSSSTQNHHTSPADGSMLGNLLGLESSDSCIWSDSSDDEGTEINEEVARYFKSGITSDKCTDPLEWWRTKEAAFPILAQLARHYLCIPATASSANEAFSQSKVRLAVETENTDVVVFLHDNQSLLIERAVPDCINDTLSVVPKFPSSLSS